MNEPKRWSELTGEASQEEHELVRAGLAERMPSELRGQVWSAITLSAAGGVAATALGTASTASATVQTTAATVGTAANAGAASKGLVLSLSTVIKGALAVAVLGGVAVGAVQMQNAPSTRASSQPLLVGSKAPAEANSAAGSEVQDGTASLGTSEPVSAFASAIPAPANVLVHPSLVVSSGRSPSSFAASRPASDDARVRDSEPSAATDVSSRLSEESAAVLAIRRTLLAGNAREALALLARARVDFPHGALAEEREALSVRALMGAGETDAARLRGAAFLSRFPRSPQAGDVKRLLGTK